MSIIIIDSGSTKARWVFSYDGQIIHDITTDGMNPNFTEKNKLNEITKTISDKWNTEAIKSVYFYGAGCGNQTGKNIIKEVLQSCFNCYIEVNTDILAVARGLLCDSQGTACILGTGSNAAFYDGKNISEAALSLGFIPADYGSGADLGKRLLSLLFYKKLPSQIVEDFQNTYLYSHSDIVEFLYRRPYPNRFLASFAPFILKHIDAPEIIRMTENAFSDFIGFQIESLSQRNEKFVFCGSVAYYFQHILKKTAKTFHIEITKIAQSPIESLVEYHNKNKKDE